MVMSVGWSVWAALHDVVGGFAKGLILSISNPFFSLIQLHVLTGATKESGCSKRFQKQDVRPYRVVDHAIQQFVNLIMEIK